MRGLTITSLALTLAGCHALLPLDERPEKQAPDHRLDVPIYDVPPSSNDADTPPDLLVPVADAQVWDQQFVCPAACKQCVGNVCEVQCTTAICTCPTLPDSWICKIRTSSAPSGITSINCSNVKTCRVSCESTGCQGPISCPSGPGTSCHVKCMAENTCGGKITCASETCTIECQKNGTCQQKTDCQGSTDCYVKCMGDNSCQMGVNCNGVANLCQVRCTGGQSCQHDIHCGGGRCEVECQSQSCSQVVDCQNACACSVTCGIPNTCGMGVICPQLCMPTGCGPSDSCDNCAP